MRSDVPMATRDRVVLRSDVYLDADRRETCPVLLLRTPYDKGFPQLGSYPHPMWFVERGYMVVIQDVRGRFGSEGDFYPFRHEGNDGFDAVEWAAGLSGSNGRVGMYGTSYSGATQFLAAAAHPPSLHAIAPAVSSATFGNGWFYEGGAFHLAFGAYWAAQLGEESFRRAGNLAKAAACRWAMNNLGEWLSSTSPASLEPIAEIDYYQDWLSHPPESDYWNTLAAIDGLATTQVAGLHIAGWYDIFLSGSLEAYEVMRRSPGGALQHLVVGAWSHFPFGTEASGAMTFPDEAAGHLEHRHLAFFETYLKDRRALLPAQLDVFAIQGETWISTCEVTASGTAAKAISQLGVETLHLTSEGNAGRSLGDGRLLPGPIEADQRDYTSYHGRYALPSAGGHSCVADQNVPLMGPADRTALDRWYEVLVYRAEPEEAGRTLAGEVRACLFVASTSPLVNVHVVLSIETDAGVMAVAEGISRVSFTRTELDAPQRIEVSLRTCAFVVKPGQTLRLEVSGGSFPVYPRESNTTAPWADAQVEDMRGCSLVVFHGPSTPSCVSIGSDPK